MKQQDLIFERNKDGYQYISNYDFNIYGHSLKSGKTINDFTIHKSYININFLNNKVLLRLWKKANYQHPNNQTARNEYFNKLQKQAVKEKHEIDKNFSAKISHYKTFDELNILVFNKDSGVFEEKPFTMDNNEKFFVDLIIPTVRKVTEIFPETETDDSLYQASINEFIYDQKKNILFNHDGSFKRIKIKAWIFKIGKNGKKIKDSSICVNISLAQAKNMLLELSIASNWIIKKEISEAMFENEVEVTVQHSEETMAKEISYKLEKQLEEHQTIKKSIEKKQSNYTPKNNIFALTDQYVKDSDESWQPLYDPDEINKI